MASIEITGARAVFEADGEILTVRAEKGEVRNLTNTPGVMGRTPVQAPDGFAGLARRNSSFAGWWNGRLAAPTAAAL